MNSRICILSMLILSCTQQKQQPTTLSAAEKATLTQEVRQTLDNYYADIREHGLMAEFAYLDSSVDFYWVPPGYTAAISYDSVAAVLRQNAPMFTSINNSFDTLRISIINTEWASYTGRLHSIMVDTSGKESSFTLVETGLLVKQQNGWKLRSGQTALIP
ncbi:MAG: nuclear transport factor 2 family protein [Bacteroidota bacterium]